MSDKTTPSPKSGDLRVWWIPQVPGKAFRVSVDSPAEAKKLLETLALYDIFQFKNKIKPDYCNAGGLEVFNAFEDGDAWCDWYDDATGNDIDEWTEQS